MTQVTDPRSGQIQFTYDSANNLLTVKDPVNNTTSWAYDHLNQATMETNALGKTRSYFYDGAGNVTRRVDRNGRAIQYMQDELNRVTSEEWHDAGGNRGWLNIHQFGAIWVAWMTGATEGECEIGAGSDSPT